MVCNDSDIQESGYKIKKTPKQKLTKLYRKMKRDSDTSAGIAIGCFLVCALFLTSKWLGFFEEYSFVIGMLTGISFALTIVMIGKAEDETHIKLKKIIDKLP